MLKKMQDAERDAIFAVADLMAAAAKTAPKGSGKDTVITAIVSGSEKDLLRDTLRKLGEEYNEAFMIRDSANIDNSECVVLIGCYDTYFGLSNCGMCGFSSCGENKKHGCPCIFNVTDLGIAVGSAVSVAADHRIDNRVMYSAGRAAVKLKMLGDNVKLCYAIPLSVTNKSIYFDRGPGAVLDRTYIFIFNRQAVQDSYRRNENACSDTPACEYIRRPVNSDENPARPRQHGKHRAYADSHCFQRFVAAIFI